MTQPPFPGEPGPAEPSPGSPANPLAPSELPAAAWPPAQQPFAEQQPAQGFPPAPAAGFPAARPDAFPGHPVPGPGQPGQPGAPLGQPQPMPAPGQPLPQAQSNPGTVLGVLSIVLPFAFLGLIGLICALLGLSRSKRAGMKNVPATIGLILSILSVLGGVALILFFAAVNPCTDLGPGVHEWEGFLLTCS